jgi:glycerol dehydrogenase-like iron-containing ADH family enzyme
MAQSIKEYYESLIKELKAEAKVIIVDEATTKIIFDGIEEDLEEYRFENQQRIKDSQEDISNVVFTA